MQKAHNNIDWENYPSDKTPLNEQNLNKMDISIDEVDNRVIVLDTTKLDKTDAAHFVQSIILDRDTGIFTITYYNGSFDIIDTLLEKIAVNFGYDAETQRLSIELDDGTVEYIDLSALITQYEFLDSDTIAFQAQADGKIKAVVKKGSIVEEYLQPNYLADIKVEVAKAQSSQTAAAESATNAENYATEAESYTHGGTGTRENEDTDNAMEYARQAKESAEQANNIVTQNVVLQSEKGVAGGVASLGNDGKVPQAQLPNTSVGVTGVKGDSELDYKTGDVNITKEDIGLGNVANERQYSASNPQPSVEGSSGSCTGNAATATKAEQDGDGNNIADTYVPNSKVVDNWDTVKETTQTGYPVGALALQQAVGKELVQTLAENETSISFTDLSITSDSTFDFYTSKFGVNPTAVSVDGNTITLTFSAQEEAISVKVKVM